MTLLRVLIMLTLLYVCEARSAYAELRPLSLRDEHPAYRLDDILSTFHDAKAEWTADQVVSRLDQFTSPKKMHMFSGTGAYWLAFAIDGELSHEAHWMLLYPWTFTDHLELFEIRGDKAISLGSTGDMQRQEATAEPYRLPYFKIHIGGETKRYLLRLSTTGPIHYDFKLLNQSQFARDSRTDLLILGILFGCILSLTAFNLLLAFRLRDAASKLYVLYLLCFTGVQFTLCGLTRYFFASSEIFPFVSNTGLVLAGEIAGWGAVLFTQKLLRLPHYEPKLNRLLLVFFPISLINMVMCFTNYPIATLFILATNSYTVPLLLIAGIRGSLRQDRTAKYYTLAWGALLTGSTLWMASTYSFIPPYPWLSWAQLIGGIVEALLMSLALGDKIEQLALRNQIAEKALLLERDTRIRLASDVAHHLNNPLNYIAMGTLGIKTQVYHLQKRILDLLDAQNEQSPELLTLKYEFNKIFQEIDESQNMVARGVDRASESVAEIRALSGVDGKSLAPIRLGDLLAKAVARLEEHIEPKRFRLLQVHDRHLEKSLGKGNFFILLHTVEPFLRTALQHCQDRVHLHIESLAQEQSYEVSWRLELVGDIQVDLRELEASQERLNQILRFCDARIALEHQHQKLIATILLPRAA